jgi:hypothetical protein
MKNVILVFNYYDHRNAQRLALPACGGRGDSPSKRDSAKARKMPEKRGAYPKSGARCVGRYFLFDGGVAAVRRSSPAVPLALAIR